MPTAAQPAKKKRKLPFENLYIAALPSSTRYFRSLMHRDVVVSATFTPFTDFLITTSQEGVIKFWKKTSESIEFVKEFKAHTDELVSSSVSADGRSFATAGKDKKIMIFDVVTFGMLPKAFVLRRLTAFRSCWYDTARHSTPVRVLGP